MYVKDLMTLGVVTVRPSDPLAVAREQLRSHGIHHLIVAENGHVVGLMSYRDLIGKGDAEFVRDVMSRDVVTVQPSETLRNAASKMIGRKHGCVAVVDGETIAGIITSTDLLHAVSLAHA